MPRAIRGERKRIQRLAKQAQAKRAEAWRAERGLVRRYPILEPQTVQVQKYGSALPYAEIYAPMLEAALKGPLELPTPMSQRRG